MQATTTAKGEKPTFNLAPTEMFSGPTPYEKWIASAGIPIHRGYYVEDARTVEVGWWDERQCNAAYLVLAGQEGVSEVRVTEIPPGATLPPVKFGLDEVVYVLDGRGLTTLWAEDGGPRTSFEWQTHSMFLLPRHCTTQLSNTRGDQPARLLHYNYLPATMNSIPDLDFLFNNPHSDPSAMDHGYSEAKVSRGGATGGMGFWTGNFFADMRAWDRLDPYKGRGAGGHVVWVQFPTSPIWAHMSVFPARSYKKAHRHGPGTLIVIPGGEGFSFMWPEGKEKVFIPWHEGSVFVPPDRWFHQHFNVMGDSARYLAMHAPRGSNQSERVENIIRDQIEYPDEDPMIRQTFEAELSKRGVKSAMPEEAYQNRSFEWKYEE